MLPTKSASSSSKPVNATFQGSWGFADGTEGKILKCSDYPGSSDAAAVAKSLQSCPTVRPHRSQPTRLPHPWDSPGKNTGVRCHFLLQCMKVKSESEVAQSCPTRRDPMDCSLPGFSIHGILYQQYWSGLPLPSPLTMAAPSK